ncbi:unnamed protein product, partial [marine sediment metagenome]
MANSKRKCAYCKERVRDYIVINTQAFCSFDEAVKYASDNKQKGAAIIKKAGDKKHAKRKKEFKDNDKSLRTKAAQSSFNAFIRARDKGLVCISCDNMPNFSDHIGGSGIHAGHFKSCGAHSELRFNELNCNVQCFKCNVHLSGNIKGYRPALIKKIGIEKVEWIEGPHEPKKYTCEELKEIELLYK